MSRKSEKIDVFFKALDSHASLDIEVFIGRSLGILLPLRSHVHPVCTGTSMQIKFCFFSNHWYILDENLAVSCVLHDHIYHIHNHVSRVRAYSGINQSGQFGKYHRELCNYIHSYCRFDFGATQKNRTHFFSLLVQFLASVLLFGITGFQATVNSYRPFLVYAYCCRLLYQFLIYCWFAHQIIHQVSSMLLIFFSCVF